MPHQPRLIKDESPQYTVDEAEKDKYRQRLRQKLQDPDFRQIEGFPLGDDQAILDLSDPPYYTACPNPFLPEIIQQWQQERAQTRQKLDLPDDTHDNGPSPISNPQSPIPDGTSANPQSPISNLQSPIYHREPFAADVSEGKNDPIYNAHSYHTKVPHKAIMRYILHYTDPGDIVFDGFCGTGMTGVAAQLCGDRKAVEGLGYVVDNHGRIYDPNNLQSPIPDGTSAHLQSPISNPQSPISNLQSPISNLGARKAVLNDLSPAATFIAYNYNTPVDAAAFELEARRILREVEKELGWMYETWHPHCDDPNRVRGKIKYTIWSDVFVCPECSSELVFWDTAVDHVEGAILDDFHCLTCTSVVNKRNLERATETVFDYATEKVIQRAKQIPVLIVYDVGKRRFTKQPDRSDLALVQRSNTESIPYYYPTTRIDKDIDIWYERDYRSLGIYSVDAFFSSRNLQIVSAIWKASQNQKNLLLFCITGILRDISKLTGVDVRKFFKGGGGPFAGGVKGTLYIPSLVVEKNVFFAFQNRVKRLVRAFKKFPAQRRNGVAVTTQSLGELPSISSNSVDYIFTDPPFGDNIIYSDLSIIWESWLKVSTCTSEEAVIHRRKKKNASTLENYTQLMVKCFAEMYRVLKPGRWITVEFHNTRNTVWNAIQEALLRAGLMVADVRTLDKKQGTFKQINASSAAKQDLVISVYKPRANFEQSFLKEAGTAEGAWSFVRQHLGQLPIVVEQDGVIETLGERQDFLLFDRMVAFHIQRGATVPLSAGEFYAGLRRRFVERDGMFFLPEQVPQYDKARLRAQRVAQLALFVTDEKSTIQWLRQQLEPALGGAPQTYQELQPQFLRRLHQARHEQLPELGDILEENFLQDEQGRWYVPDPNKAGDLEKLRHKALLREFQTYLEGHKKLRHFRTEAIRAGFAHAWRQKDYATIVRVGGRLPEAVLQEDPDLLMYYDNAGLRL